MKKLLYKIIKREPFLLVYDKIKLIYFKYIKSDEGLIRKKFKLRLEREADLTAPTRYNDKLQWLKLHWHDPVATQCADKYEVRDYVKKTIGNKYLNVLLGVYESPSEIDIESLPRSFVLKGTHGSGFNIICKDKDKMDWKKEFNIIKRWMRTNYYWANREWVYKDIKPRIICEKYMSDEAGNPPADYKIFCFHGEPKLIQVDVDRFGNHVSNLYTPDWKFRNVEIKNTSDERIEIKKPATLEEMLFLSRKLSKRFPHVRVDFYNVENKVIFGELTFFHHSGMGEFRPSEFEDEMGSYLDLTKI